MVIKGNIGIRLLTEESKAHHRKIHPILLIPFLICISLVLYFADIFPETRYMLVHFKGPHPEDMLVFDESVQDGFLVNTEGCRIPNMDPFDEKIKKFINKEEPPKCADGKPPLVDSNLTSIFFVESSLAIYNQSEVSCCYSAVRRRDPTNTETDDKFDYDKKCTNFSDSVDITDEYIRVTCSNSSGIFYKDFFSFIPLKENITFYKKQNETKLNILVIGIDAVSRLNFHRQMPKTVEYLLNLSAVELLGYNKVGDNTFPNLIPFLTGKTEEELTCWENGEHFDNCTFLWDLYKYQGYVTSFGEDSSWMGIFNYQRKGFLQQPTDYAFSYFDRIAERETGNQHRMNVDRCIGPREAYKIFLDYLTKFVYVMDKADLPYFSFNWGASISHDYLNTPQYGDDTYYEFLKYLKQGDYLKDTVLIFMSDHGIRWGDIRQTYQGRMEERLPFVFMVLPEWYRNEFQTAYRNLKRNARRLTTPYDLHQTLLDLTQPLQLSENFLQQRNSNFSRGYSLFSNIITNRTCEDAGIKSHWCTCQQSFEISTNDSLIVHASSFVVGYMNSLLSGYAQCANLTLDSTLNARLMSHDGDISKSDKIQDYMITLTTLPGEGIFEVTVRESQQKNRTKKFEVVGTISRLNLYGKQSGCISDFHMKLYCYCKSLLS